MFFQIVAPRFALVLIVWMAASSAAVASNWRIIQSTGQSKLLGAAASTSGELPDGAVIVTGSDSRVVVEGDYHKIALMPMSKMELTSSSAGAWQATLMSGLALVKTENPGDAQFEFFAPNLVIYAHKAKFRIDAHAMASTVKVEQGTLSIGTTSRPRSALLQQGDEARVLDLAPDRIEFLHLHQTAAPETEEIAPARLESNAPAVRPLTNVGGVALRDSAGLNSLGDVQEYEDLGNRAASASPPDLRFQLSGDVRTSEAQARIATLKEGVGQLTATDTDALRRSTYDEEPGFETSDRTKLLSALRLGRPATSAQARPAPREPKKNAKYKFEPKLEIPFAMIGWSTLLLFLLMVISQILQVERRNNRQQRRPAS